MLTKILDDPRFTLRTGAEHFRAEHVGNHEIVVAALPCRWQRIMRQLIREKGDGDERRLAVAPLALLDSSDNGGAEILGFRSESSRLVLFAQVGEDSRQVAQATPAIGIGTEGNHVLID